MNDNIYHDNKSLYMTIIQTLPWKHYVEYEKHIQKALTNQMENKRSPNKH